MLTWWWFFDEISNCLFEAGLRLLGSDEVFPLGNFNARTQLRKPFSRLSLPLIFEEKSQAVIRLSKKA